MYLVDDYIYIYINYTNIGLININKLIFYIYVCEHCLH